MRSAPTAKDILLADAGYSPIEVKAGRTGTWDAL